jgi:hypothetical protein
VKVGEPKGMRILGMSSYNIIKTEHKGKDFVECIRIVQGRGECWALVNMIMNSGL